MRKHSINYPDLIARLIPHDRNLQKNDEKILSKSVTFQVTDSCNLACTYCYQTHKGKQVMSLEVAKKFVDLILSDELEYINTSNSPAVVFEFIGGEPFLEAKLISEIVDYIERRLIILEHPWACFHIYSICSNGTLYFEEEVQSLMKKLGGNVSFSVTIDGNKQLHDSCRVFPDGRPSYDLAWAAAKDWIDRGYEMGSKITIAPENLDYIYDAIVHIINLGYAEINANTIYEKGWVKEDAARFYHLLKRIADYVLEKDLDNEINISLFAEEFFKPKPIHDNDNWCGGNGMMIACDPVGDIYPCLRYMKSSLGESQKPLVIGNVYDGIEHTSEQKDCVTCLQGVNRRSQSTDECFYCPIAGGCAWCSAYNYQETGTPDKRVTYSCDMHKARSLANVYYWNKYYRKNGIDNVFDLFCPDEWALEIVTEEELNKIKELTRRG